MRPKAIGLVAALSMVAAACGAGTLTGLPDRSEDPLVQIRSEGGFAPVEMVLGHGPTYTLLANGQLIYEGPVIAIYPGPLLPKYQEVEISDDERRTVLDLVEKMGLPDFEEERDDSANQLVADATTEVVTYWDENGTHSYAVYALGIEPNPSEARIKAFLDLVDLMSELTASNESVPYEAERVQVIAGVGFADPEFPDVREWPFENTDLSEWEVLPNQWMCKMFGPEVLPTFEDANQNTQWTHPDPMMDAPPFTLLVRPLHPGEPDCPEGL